VPSCAIDPPNVRWGKRSRGDGLSQRTGLMSAMNIGAIEVRPGLESEKTMSWPEVAGKAVSNSDEVAFCSSSNGRRETVAATLILLGGAA
jgi:hypothetical protein